MPNFNDSNLNQIFVRCSSQTLCGIKPANLFTLPLKDFSRTVFRKWQQIVSEQNLSIKAFKSSSNTMMIFVYNMPWIRMNLGDSFVQAYLKGKNYSCPENTEKALNEIFYRLQTSVSFPHEVGIFLGYPIEDVICFEETQGHNCKYCGYWKSYCHPEEARKCCDRYRKCSQLCKQWFDEGYSIPQIIRKYKETAEKAA